MQLVDFFVSLFMPVHQDILHLGHNILDPVHKADVLGRDWLDHFGCQPGPAAPERVAEETKDRDRDPLLFDELGKRCDVHGHYLDERDPGENQMTPASCSSWWITPRR